MYMHLGRRGGQACHRSKEWYECRLGGSSSEAKAQDQEASYFLSIGVAHERKRDKGI
jgi:hypothetical protein